MHSHGYNCMLIFKLLQVTVPHCSSGPTAWDTIVWVGTRCLMFSPTRLTKHGSIFFQLKHLFPLMQMFFCPVENMGTMIISMLTAIHINHLFQNILEGPRLFIIIVGITNKAGPCICLLWDCADYREKISIIWVQAILEVVITWIWDRRI